MIAMGSVRAFLAIYPDDAAGTQVRLFRDRMKRAASGTGIRWAKDDQLHLTLRFMGELPEEKIEDLAELLRSATAGCRRFPLTARWAGAPWRSARVIALVLESPGAELRNLQEEAERCACTVSQEPEPKAFQSHLTLARLENPRLQPKSPSATVATWEAREVVLVRSELGDGGARHSPIGRFPLQ